MDSDVTVGDTFSPASKYEAMLLEKGGPGLTENKTLLVFQVLDQIVPHLGVFSEVVKLCRNELLEAVYSDQYTGSDKRYIQRLPYFVLVKRLYIERDENADQLKQQLEVVKKRLFERQKQYDNECVKVDKLENQVQELKNTVESLEHCLKERKEEIQQLHEQLEEEREQAQQQEQELQHDLMDVKQDLEEAQQEVQFLKQFKQGYDNLQRAFNEFTARDEVVVPKKKKKPTISTKRANFLASIENSLKLEEQLLTVQNLTVEEFDKFLEEHKNELTKNLADTDSTEDMSHRDQELMIIQNQFHQDIDDINSELVLLRQQRTMVQEQLQILEANKPTLIKKKKAKSRASRPTTQESFLSGDATADGAVITEDEDDVSDPFIPQERVFAKYAAMLYTSDNNGKNFHEFKDAKYCPSCFEKTVLCPHKILQQEHVFMLPPNSTHLKVSRPKVKIQLEMLEMFRPQTSRFSEVPDSYSIAASPQGKHMRGHPAAQGSPSYHMETPVEGAPSEVFSVTNTPVDTTHFTHTIERLWEDYKNRTALDRAVQRSLTLTRTLSMMEQFSAFIVQQDEQAGTVPAVHMLDQLYLFLSQRYEKSDVTFFAAHDLITALAEYTSSNKLIWIFSQVLISNLDGSVLRYILLLADFINLVDWKHVDDFKAFAQIIYPFLNDDDLDTFQMGYTSFSENKVSKILVCEYLIYNIMKYREPRFLEMENKLLNVPGKEQSLMTENEFIDSSDNALSIVNDNLRRKLYQETLHMVTEKDKLTGGVPVLRLAQIGSYLELLQIQTTIKDTIHAAVAEVQAKRDPALAASGNPRPANYSLITMTTVKTLAHNLAKESAVREQKNGLC